MSIPLNSLNGGNELNALLRHSNRACFMDVDYLMTTSLLRVDDSNVVTGIEDKLGYVSDDTLSSKGYHSVRVRAKILDITTSDEFVIEDGVSVNYNSDAECWFINPREIYSKLTHGHRYCGLIEQAYDFSGYWEPSYLPNPKMQRVLISEFIADDKRVEKTLSEYGYEITKDNNEVECFVWIDPKTNINTFKARVYRDGSGNIDHKGGLVKYDVVF